jgi:hypothetical protein
LGRGFIALGWESTSRHLPVSFSEISMNAATSRP